MTTISEERVLCMSQLDQEYLGLNELEVRHFNTNQFQYKPSQGLLYFRPKTDDATVLMGTVRPARVQGLPTHVSIRNREGDYFVEFEYLPVLTNCGDLNELGSQIARRLANEPNNLGLANIEQQVIVAATEGNLDMLAGASKAGYEISSIEPPKLTALFRPSRTNTSSTDTDSDSDLGEVVVEASAGIFMGILRGFGKFFKALGEGLGNLFD